MRLIFSEFPADYSHYRFPYQVWAVRDHKDNLAQIYSSGWLPFRSKKDLYCLARGIRIRLSQFQLSSENRRILRKTEGLNLSVQPVDQFTYTPAVQKLCANFARSKFGKGVMPTAAIRKLFTNANTTHVISYTDTVGQQPVGYAAVVVHEHFLHYAHPFVDVSYDNPDAGLGMMTQAIQWAQIQHKQFAYLGTCYTPESLYKTQFSGFEFFNGYSWSDNLDELKGLISRTSSEHLLEKDSDYRQKYLPGFSEEWLAGQGSRVGFK